MLRPAGPGFRSSAEPLRSGAPAGRCPRRPVPPRAGKNARPGRTGPESPGRGGRTAWGRSPPCPGPSPHPRRSQAVPRPFSRVHSGYTDISATDRMIRGAVSRSRSVQSWWYMHVPTKMPVVVCTWAMGTFAAAAGIAEPTRADPATPSARMAGITNARPMRMIPPWRLLRPAGQ